VSPSTPDRIEKEIVLAAPRDRVWRALTDVRQFNEWFGVALTSPFVPGAVVRGQITIAEYTHVTCTMWVETMEPERRFAFRWHPYAIEPHVDYASEPTTLVTFTLAEDAGGTRLTVVESGFDAIPEARRNAAFLSNTRGWEMQLERVQQYLAGAAAT
jgi:uncharacterized protein YndB with AHSA1/START domain